VDARTASWSVSVDTARAFPSAASAAVEPATGVTLAGRSLVLLQAAAGR
jgi:hypothetical protein